jgi:hypothetical protein
MEFNKYEGQLDRFIDHLARYGLTLVRDTPLHEQSLPTGFSLLDPPTPATEMPTKVDVQAYEPPNTPKRQSKRRRGKPRASKTKAKGAKGQRASTASGEDDDDDEYRASESDGGSLTPSAKRIKL